jgi:hypothetical protein
MLQVEVVVSHISQKTSEIPRVSCTMHRTRQRVRLSLRKGAWSSRNQLNFSGNRGYGAPRTSWRGQASVLSHSLQTVPQQYDE